MKIASLPLMAVLLVSGVSQAAQNRFTAEEIKNLSMKQMLQGRQSAAFECYLAYSDASGLVTYVTKNPKEAVRAVDAAAGNQRHASRLVHSCSIIDLE